MTAAARILASYFHVHLVSDSTGETLNAVFKAATAQSLLRACALRACALPGLKG